LIEKPNSNESLNKRTPFNDNLPLKRQNIRWNNTKKLYDVFVACHSKEDARNAALNHGIEYFKHQYYNNPIHDDNHNPEDPQYFDHYHLGKDNQKIITSYNGVSYDYHYYYGVNNHGKIARQLPGYDPPVPYIFKIYKTPPQH